MNVKQIVLLIITLAGVSFTSILMQDNIVKAVDVCPSGQVWVSDSDSCKENTYKCSAGQMYSETDGCITYTAPTCPSGQQWSPTDKKCVTGGTSGAQCPVGQEWSTSEKQCVRKAGGSSDGAGGGDGTASGGGGGGSGGGGGCPTVILKGINCDSGTSLEGSGPMQLLRIALTILSALVGVAAVGVLIYAGIMYSSAGGNSQQVSSAKGMITNTIIGLLAYIMMFFFINWLLPGGVLG